jgi:hypothetical protein
MPMGKGTYGSKRGRPSAFKTCATCKTPAACKKAKKCKKRSKK